MTEMVPPSALVFIVVTAELRGRLRAIHLATRSQAPSQNAALQEGTPERYSP